MRWGGPSSPITIQELGVVIEVCDRGAYECTEKTLEICRADVLFFVTGAHYFGHR